MPLLHGTPKNRCERTLKLLELAIRLWPERSCFCVVDAESQAQLIEERRLELSSAVRVYPL